MEEEFRTLLTDAVSVTTHAPKERINWGRRVGLSAIALHQIAGTEGLTHTGPDGLTNSVVQVDCWAATFKGARDLANAVNARLHGFKGGAFKVIRVEGRRTTFEPGEGADGSAAPTGFHRTSLDVRVWHSN